MANPNKYRKLLATSTALAFFFFMANVALAKMMTFQEEYTYQASEADSKISSRAIALEQVKRLVLEKLGTYLESETEVKNFQLTKDQIVTLTGGIVSAEIFDEKWDGKTYSLKAKITADPKDVINSIEKLRGDRQKTKELEETRKKAAEALKEVERLKRELEIAKGGKAEQEQYNKAVNRLSATDWFEKGLGLVRAGKHQEGLEAFTKAIELDPKDAKAYNNRGIAYGDLGNHQQAIKDYDKAIQVDPKDAKAYYNNRGNAYGDLGNHQQAIKDYDKAIELDPKDAMAYYNRGIAYANLRNYQQAIRDYDKAIELNPKGAMSYNNRGVAYGKLGNYQQAIRDYDKAIELNPQYAMAYDNRGIAYGKLGNYQQAIRDCKIAARLGLKVAQDFLRSQGIEW